MSRYLKKKVNCPDMEPTWSTWDFPSKANLQRIVCQRTGTWDGQTIINHLHAKPWHPSSSVLVFLGIFSGIFMDLLGCPCEGQRPLRLDPRSRGKCHKPRLPHKGIIRERQFDMKFWWIRMPKLFCEDLTRFLKQIEWHWYELVWNASRIARARSVPARVLGPSCCRCWGSLALQHLQQSCWKTRFNSPNAQGPSHLQLSASTWPRHRGRLLRRGAECSECSDATQAMQRNNHLRCWPHLENSQSCFVFTGFRWFFYHASWKIQEPLPIPWILWISPASRLRSPNCWKMARCSLAASRRPAASRSRSVKTTNQSIIAIAIAHFYPIWNGLLRAQVQKKMKKEHDIEMEWH